MLNLLVSQTIQFIIFLYHANLTCIISKDVRPLNSPSGKWVIWLPQRNLINIVVTWSFLQISMHNTLHRISLDLLFPTHNTILHINPGDVVVGQVDSVITS